MKKYLNITNLCLAFSFLFVAGCVDRSADQERSAIQQSAPLDKNQIIVKLAPPPLKKEALTEKPGTNHVWTPGHWVWHADWIWVDGQWVVPPNPNAIWVPEKYVPKRDGYVFVDGYWR